jgi:hypothetical protein
MFGAPMAAADDVQAAATEACKCLEAPYAKFDEIMKVFNAARASGDYSKIQSMESEMAAIGGEAEKCFEALQEKYPAIAADKSQRDRVGEVAEKQCPNPAREMFSR